MALLEGKTIVIIGAGLLGSEFARACAAENASVVIADVDKKRGGALADTLSARFEHVDITSPSSVEELVKRVGSVDGVVNAAYPKTKTFGAKFEDGTVEDMLQNLDMHVGGCMSTAKYFAPRMKAGSIVFLGSIYGLAAPRAELYENTKMIGVPPEYAAAKAAVIALARYFARMYGSRNVRFNAVSPGGVADGQPAAFVEKYSQHLAIGNGLLKPSDVSGAVVFLLSDTAKHITGQNIVVDGGWTL
ncbi:SDR family oxidoreductase [Candidatus Kaiserbacteria bacterium]|nr:SDR family oxidoreductase [Candidatus Kaiserbacteria bacterium]